MLIQPIIRSVKLQRGFLPLMVPETIRLRLSINRTTPSIALPAQPLTTRLAISTAPLLECLDLEPCATKEKLQDLLPLEIQWFFMINSNLPYNYPATKQSFAITSELQAI